MGASSWVEIDLDAVRANVEVLRAAAPSAELCAVVKADGYGHGAPAVAETALGAGATRLAVAQASEALPLRDAGIDAPIWLLSEPRPDQWGTVAMAELEPTVYTRDGIEWAATIGATVHVKIDTGMHRVGADPSDAVDLVRQVEQTDDVELGSVWTHLACADDETAVDPGGCPVTSVQLDCYEAVLDRLAAAGIEVPLRHAANSAGTIAHPRAHHDVVRCGIAIYGLAPSSSLGGRVPLRPALSWRTTVAHVKRLRAGDGLSYGHRYRLDRDAVVATIPVGYADGYRRRLWATGGAVLIGGRRRSILGVVTMDQTIVDCGDDEIGVGDEVTLIGRQGEDEVTADELAERLDTINYEITCAIGDRVERRFTPPWRHGSGPPGGRSAGGTTRPRPSSGSSSGTG